MISGSNKKKVHSAYLAICVAGVFMLSHPASGQELYVDFEEFNQPLEFVHLFGGAYLDIVENPMPTDINSSQKVAKTYKESYEAIPEAGMSADLEKGYLIRDGINKISIDVLARDAPGMLKLKLESYILGPDPRITEFDRKITEVGKWERLVFDVSNLEHSLYNRIVLFFGFGEITEEVYFFDNLKFE